MSIPSLLAPSPHQERATLNALTFFNSPLAVRPAFADVQWPDRPGRGSKEATTRTVMPHCATLVRSVYEGRPGRLAAANLARSAGLCRWRGEIADLWALLPAGTLAWSFIGRFCLVALSV